MSSLRNRHGVLFITIKREREAILRVWVRLSEWVGLLLLLFHLKTPKKLIPHSFASVTENVGHDLQVFIPSSWSL